MPNKWVVITPPGVALTCTLNPDGKTVDITAPTGYRWSVEINQTNPSMVDIQLLEAITQRAIARNFVDLIWPSYIISPPINNSYLPGDILQASPGAYTTIKSESWQQDHANPNYLGVTRCSIAVMGIEYIYYVKPNNRDFIIVEYNISNGTTSEIIVYETNDVEKEYLSSFALTYVEERKVLCWCNGDYNSDTVYLLDFQTSTKTTELTYPSPVSLFTLKKNNGNILVFSMGYNASGYLTIYYKDWTNSGTWTEASLESGYYDFYGVNPIFFKEDYLCWFQIYRASYYSRSIKGCALNLSDFTVQYTTALNSQNTEYMNPTISQNNAISHQTNKLYGTLSGSYGVTYHSFLEIFEFDPTTNTITSIYYETATAQPYLSAFLSSSKSNAHCLKRHTNTIHSLPSMSQIGTHSETQEVLAGFDDQGGITRLNIDGKLYIGETFITTSSWTYRAANKIAILHNGADILVCIFTDVQTPSSLIHDYTVKIIRVY